MWLANRWREGLFGELIYAEYEYVHECRSLAYTYSDGKPVEPGHHPHNWRSWQDFHYFAREIFTGEKGPFDIYGAADVTIPGIQALRSSLDGGRPMEVPDFRNPAERARYRADDWEQERYPVTRGVFGGVTPAGLGGQFHHRHEGHGGVRPPLSRLGRLEKGAAGLGAAGRVPAGGRQITGQP